MTADFFNLIEKILNQNPVSHKVEFSNQGTPKTWYTIFAKYNTTEHRVKQAVLQIAHTPSKNIIEIYIGDKCVYAKQYQCIHKPINYSNTNNQTTEDDFIRTILNICNTKTANVYLKQLNEIEQFLNDLKTPDKEK